MKGPVTGSGFFCWWLREAESTLISAICGPRDQDTEHHALGLQLFAQGAVVLDDSVLHHRHAVGAIEVRVGVAFFRLAMGGPAGVADAALPGAPAASNRCVRLINFPSARRQLSCRRPSSSRGAASREPITATMPHMNLKSALDQQTGEGKAPD